MPSTVVHLALGALIAAALLHEDYDGPALAVVLAAVAFPDLDTVIGVYLPGTHRAALHTLLVPAGLALLVAYDVRWRERSWLRDRWGSRGVRVAGVSLLAYVVAAIVPDLFFNGVNVLYPIHDRFYQLWGDVLLTDQRGFVQTVWEGTDPPETAGAAGGTSVVGTTETVHYSTGVDVDPGPDPPEAERVFPIFRGGTQAVVVLAGLVITSIRLWEVRRRADAE